MRRTPRIVAAAGLAVVAMSGMAIAHHKGLEPIFNARGTIDPVTLRDKDLALKIKAREPLDVAIVAAKLHPAGQTGWHTHPADSIVSVQPGAPALEMVIPHRHGACVRRLFEPGEAFVHPAGPHNFVNTDSTRDLNFGVAYFVPVGAPLLTPAQAPSGAGCQ